MSVFRVLNFSESTWEKGEFQADCSSIYFVILYTWACKFNKKKKKKEKEKE